MKSLEEKRAHKRELLKAWRRRNPQRQREINRRADRKAYLRDPEKIRASARKSMRLWAMRHPEQKKERDKQTRLKALQRHPEKFREQARKRKRRYRIRHRVRLLAKHRNETYARYCHFQSTQAETKACYEYILRESLRNYHRCYYCQKRFRGAFHIDHIIPFSKDGRHIISNLCVACAHCNHTKASKLPGHFQPPTNQLILAL